MFPTEKQHFMESHARSTDCDVWDSSIRQEKGARRADGVQEESGVT